MPTASQALRVLLLVILGTNQAWGQGSPGRRELSTARYHLENEERRVEEAGGKKVDLGGSRAVKRIHALSAKYPHHPEVKKLAMRVEKLVVKAEGTSFRITPKMLAYRSFEVDLSKRFALIAKDCGAKFRTRHGTNIKAAFPIANPSDGRIDEHLGTLVEIPSFEYPENEFLHNGASFVFAGDERSGYYFAKVLDPSFLVAYQALKRFRVKIDGRPEAGWTVVGRITGARLMAPHSRRGRIELVLGWQVEIVALEVAQRTFIEVRTGKEPSASFAGEAQVEKLLAGNYTITKAPTQDDPARLLEAYQVAVKQKNRALFDELLLPENPILLNPGDLEAIWKRAQEGFRTRYVHLQLVKADPVQSFERTTEEGAPAKPYQHQRLWIRIFDEKGKQRRGLVPMKLQRVPLGRWTILSGHSF